MEVDRYSSGGDVDRGGREEDLRRNEGRNFGGVEGHRWNEGRSFGGVEGHGMVSGRDDHGGVEVGRTDRLGCPLC